MDGAVLRAIAALDAAQDIRGVRGPVMEIGVHEGRLFLGLHHLQRDGERGIAIDVFGDQHLNRDGSGRGDAERFASNLERWGRPSEVRVLQRDSTTVRPDDVLEIAGGRPRLLSIDGGHDEEVVASDLRLAEAVIASGGVVIVDDVFNERWPGVGAATVRHLEGGSALCPFVITHNKTLLAHAEFAGDFAAAVVGELIGRGHAVHRTRYVGHVVDVVVPITAVDRLRRHRIARAAYHRMQDQILGVPFRRSP